MPSDAQIKQHQHTWLEYWHVFNKPTAAQVKWPKRGSFRNNLRFAACAAPADINEPQASEPMLSVQVLRLYSAVTHL